MYGQAEGRAGSTEISNLNFITGVPRSGTTLVSSALNKIEGVFVPIETHYFEFIQTSFIKKYSKTRRDSFVRGVLIENGVSNKKAANLAVPRDIDDAYLEVVDSLKKHHMASNLIEKTPNHYQYLLRSKHKRKIKVVHIIRDPRDVYISRQKVPWGRKSAYEISREFSQSAKFEKNLVEQGVPHLIVRYEAIIAQPEYELEKICSFFGLQYSESILTPGVTKDLNLENEHWKSKNAEKIDPGNTEKWRSHSNESWLPLLERSLKYEMKQYGYKCSDTSPTLLSLILYGLHGVVAPFLNPAKHLRRFR